MATYGRLTSLHSNPICRLRSTILCRGMWCRWACQTYRHRFMWDYFLSQSRTRASPSRTAESWQWLGTMANTEKRRPATSLVNWKDGGETVTERANARAGSYRILKIAVNLQVHGGFASTFAQSTICVVICWPIPKIAQTLERIGSKKPKVFAKFHMTSGYFQMAFGIYR
jgi:hypothetical protein